MRRAIRIAAGAWIAAAGLLFGATIFEAIQFHPTDRISSADLFGCFVAGSFCIVALMLAVVIAFGPSSKEKGCQ